MKFEETEIQILYSNYLIDINNDEVREYSEVDFEPVDSRMLHTRYSSKASQIGEVEIESFTLETLETDGFDSFEDTDLANIDLRIFSDLDIKVIGKFYDIGMANIKFVFTLDDPYTPQQIIALINALIDYDIEFYCENTDGKKTLFEYISEYTTLFSTSDKYKIMNNWESFSIISPGTIDPHFKNVEEYYDEPHYTDIAVAAIRRLLNFEGARLDLFRDKEDVTTHNTSIALHKEDIAILNYHNALLYLNKSGQKELYINIIETIKSLSVFLHYTDTKSFDELQALTSTEMSVDEKRDRIEELRIELIETLQTFDMLTGVASTRANRIIDYMVQNLRVDELESTLRQRLDDINSIVTNQHQTAIQNQQGQTLDEMVQLENAASRLELLIIGVYGLQAASIIIELWFGGFNEFASTVGREIALGIIVGSVCIAIGLGYILTRD
jgi:hypothetical protein